MVTDHIYNNLGRKREEKFYHRKIFAWLRKKRSRVLEEKRRKRKKR